MVLSARPGERGQGTTSIGRGLYVERLTAGSTAAARKCLLITRKIMIPPPDSWDPPDGPLYFTKKIIRPPDCWDPPTTSSHARKCVRAKKTIRPPDIWDPLEGPLYFAKNVPPLTCRTHQLSSHARKCLLIKHKKMNTPPASWNAAYWEADLWAYQVDGDGGLCQLSQYERF